MQSSKCVIALSGLLLLATAGPLAAAGKYGETVGTAYDLESGDLLYRETHCVSPDGGERQVVYEDANGQLIAQKLLDYSTGRTTPSFVQHNHYSSNSIEVALSQNAVSMAVIDKNDGSLSKAVAEPSKAMPVVIDAGFDGFVREHWEELVSGGSREFQFPFAKRASLVELRIQPLACSYDTQTDQCFRLDLANWFLRMLVAPIELGYDAETRQLTRYRGLSNIGDGNGNGLVVDIRYDYDDIGNQACQLIDQTLTRYAPAAVAPDDQS